MIHGGQNPLDDAEMPETRFAGFCPPFYFYILKN